MGAKDGDLEMAAMTTEGANVMDGTRMKNGELNISRTESPASSKVVGKKKYRSRSASASSQDSYSSDSCSGIYKISLPSPYLNSSHRQI